MFFSREKPKILIDVDDTLANTRQGVYSLYVETTGDRSGNINVKSKIYKDFCPLWNNEDIESLFHNGYTLYERVEPMPGAKAVVTALINKGYEIQIVTKHLPSGVDAKHKWLQKHFPELSNKVYYIDFGIKNKDVFKEYALIDDDLENIKTNESGKPILIDYYNIYPDLQNYIKCKSWEQILGYF